MSPWEPCLANSQAWLQRLGGGKVGNQTEHKKKFICSYFKVWRQLEDIVYHLNISVYAVYNLYPTLIDTELEWNVDNNEQHVLKQS